MRRRTRVQSAAELVLGRFYRIRAITSYETAKSVHPALPALLMGIERALVKKTRRAA